MPLPHRSPTKAFHAIHTWIDNLQVNIKLLSSHRMRPQHADGYAGWFWKLVKGCKVCKLVTKLHLSLAHHAGRVVQPGTVVSSDLPCCSKACGCTLNNILIAPSCMPDLVPKVAQHLSCFADKATIIFVPMSRSLASQLSMVSCET